MRYSIDRAAVIGAGTMGAALAAYIANAGIPVYLLDVVPDRLTPEEEANGLTLQHPAVRNRLASAGLARVKKSKPSGFFSEDNSHLVTVGNLEDNFGWVADADWILEAVVERLPVKQQIMARLDEVRKPGAIVSTNTSGLTIASVCAGRSDSFREHFLGTHFFNPPRVMKLLEVVPGHDTLPEVVAFMTRFGERTLGKGVVVCKDTPNFIDNRLISFCNAFDVSFALENGYTVEEIDNLAGPLIGRPRTGVFRWIDLVGLDVLNFVRENLYPVVSWDEDREVLRSPKMVALFEEMLGRGWLGGKAGLGFYKTVQGKDGKKEFWTLNFETMEHQPPARIHLGSAGTAASVRSLAERLKLLMAAEDRDGQCVRAILSFWMGYSAKRVPEITGRLVDVDNAVRWGLAYEMGPFETWDTLGVAETAERMEGEGIQVVPWVGEMLASGCPTFYQYEGERRVGYYDPSTRGYQPLPANPT